jgi:3-deoxy-D-manno-octulosonic-acid transferase
LLVTTTRLDLREWLRTLFPNDLILPAPFDKPSAVARFWRAVKPELIIWLGIPERPNSALLRSVSSSAVPVLLLDLTASDVDRVPRTCFADATLRQLLFFAVRDEQALAAIRARGAPPSRAAVTGDLRLAYAPAAPDASRPYLLAEAGLDGTRRVILAERVPRDEQDLILDAFADVRRESSAIVLLVEPAFRREVRALEDACRTRGLTCAIRGNITAAPDVIVFPRRGELAGFYGLADVTIVAGSFTPPGETQHNPAGAASSGSPTLFGPHVPPEADLARAFLAAGAAMQTSTAQLASALKLLIDKEGDALASRAEQFRARHAPTDTAIFDVIQPFLPPAGDPRPILQEWRRPSRVERLAASTAGRAALQIYRRQEFRSWESLRNRLGDPRSILCLGNGPSSEDPRLLSVGHDALFRVNCSWDRRPFLNRPDVVFVGDMQAVFRLPKTILAFRNIQWERYQLFRRLLGGRLVPPEFFTLEALPLAVSPDQWTARPTNGALMVLAAVMLQPPRLILGGIDLFAHSNGRYPGELVSPNAYAQVHDRDVDLHFIAACLRLYTGELIVVGDILARALSGVEGVAVSPQSGAEGIGAGRADQLHRASLHGAVGGLHDEMPIAIRTDP